MRLPSALRVLGEVPQAGAEAAQAALAEVLVDSALTLDLLGFAFTVLDEKGKIVYFTSSFYFFIDFIRIELDYLFIRINVMINSKKNQLRQGNVVFALDLSEKISAQPINW